jgi:ATP-grasp domain
MHILVIDPRPSSRDYIIRHWSDSGHRVSSAGAPPSPQIASHLGRHEDALLADRSATVDAARRIARWKPVDGVVAYSQAATCAANWVAHDLSLPPVWKDPELDLRDKAAVARLWRAADVAHPKTLEVQGPDDGDLATVPAPAIVKPASMMGGLGVRRCETADEIRWWVRHLANTSTWAAAGERVAELSTKYGMKRSVLVQQILQPDPVRGGAPEFTLECAVNDGQVHAIASFQKYHSPAPFFEERTYFLPAPDLSARQFEQLAKLAQQAISALGYQWGICHLESCFQAGQPWLFEINPRLIGETPARLLSAASDVHVADMLLSAATGKPVQPNLKRIWAGCVRICAGQEFDNSIFEGLEYSPPGESITEWIDLNRPLGYEIHPPGVRPSQILAYVSMLSGELSSVEERVSYWLAPGHIKTGSQR